MTHYGPVGVYNFAIQADVQFESLSKRFLYFRHMSKAGLKWILRLTLLRSILWMSTEMEIFLYSIRDIETVIFGLCGWTLVYWYLNCGKPICEIHMKTDMSKIRISTMIDGDGKIKYSYFSRTDINPVQFERVQAMQPIYVKGKCLGHFPVTRETTVANRLAFELAFGPHAYNAYQFFQVKVFNGINIHLPHVFIRPQS